MRHRIPVSARIRRWMVSGLVWKGVLPLLLGLATLALGVCSGRFLLSTGLLIGETTYIDEPPDTAFWRLGQVFGLLFLFSAYLIVACESLADPIRQTRVWLWAPGAPRIWRSVAGAVRSRSARGAARFLWRRKYIVVCGLGWKGREIARNALRRGVRVAAIDKDRGNPFLSDLREEGAVVFVADATDASVLRRAGVSGAERIFVTSSGDDTDCRIVAQIERLLDGRRATPCLAEAPLRLSECAECEAPSDTWCHVGLEGYRSCIFLENRRRASQLHVSCFRIEETIVRDLFRREVWPRIAAHRPRHVAFHVVGFNPVARQIVVHLLRSLHLRREMRREILVVCDEAERERLAFLREYPCLAQAIVRDGRSALERGEADLSSGMRQAVDGLFPVLRFVELPRSNTGLLSSGFALYGHVRPEADPSETSGWHTAVFYCLDDGVKSQALADLIQPRLDWMAAETNRRVPQPCEVHARVYYNYPEDAEPPEPDGGESGPARFGSYARFCDPVALAESPLERRARAVAAYFHTAYANEGEREKLKRLLSAPFVSAAGRSPIDCYLGLLWERSAEWERESNLQAADHIPAKLAVLGYEVDDEGAIRGAKARGPAGAATDGEPPETPASGRDAADAVRQLLHFERDADGRIVSGTPELPLLAEMEHRRWMAERLMGGWIALEGDGLERWHRDKPYRNSMKRDQRHHGDLVPFLELPERERTKDYDIIASIPLLGRPLREVVEQSMEATGR